VVIGEGEETLPELIRSIGNADCDPADVEGIAYLDGGRCVITGKRPPVDLDKYPPFSGDGPGAALITAATARPHACLDTGCGTAALKWWLDMPV
jgi:radical SAM superfamily enzyme YgiQ (UPF0313 family)